jgi:uncharacterized integral membrane protein
MTYPPENRPPATPEAAELPLAPLPPELSGTGTGLEPVGTEPEKHERAKVARTRISAVWVGIWAGVLVLILMIIFIAQNTASVQISFFALEGQISLALALLIAGVAGAIIAMAVGAFRILQLRREVRRRH